MNSSSRKDDRDGAGGRRATGLRAKESEKLSAIAPVACYCLASILMTVVNKFVVSGRHFNMNFLLLCLQSTVCSAVVYSVKQAGIINFRNFDTKDAKAWFPVSFLLVAVIYTGSKSLQYLTIPVYTIFKNLTIILIAYGEVFWFGGRVTRLTFLSFIFMVLSSIVAAWSDVSSAGSKHASPVTSADDVAMNYVNMFRNLNAGYFWMLLNCLTSAAYVLLMRIRIKATGFSDWDSMFYNNFLSIPVLAVFSLLFENWSAQSLTRNFPPETRNLLLFAIAFSGAAAVGISFTTAWCIRATSSTTYSMVGALNKLPVAASGILFFNEPATFGSVSAIGIGFIAGLLYAVAKNEQKKAESASRTHAETIIPLTSRK